MQLKSGVYITLKNTTESQFVVSNVGKLSKNLGECFSSNILKPNSYILKVCCISSREKIIEFQLSGHASWISWQMSGWYRGKSPAAVFSVSNNEWQRNHTVGEK